MRIVFVIIVIFCLCNHHLLLAQDQDVIDVISEEFVFTAPPTKQCHASTLVETKNGGILVAWFGGSYEGAEDVCIWGAMKINDQWVTPIKIACGENSDGSTTPCWNPVLFRPDDSSIILFYKQGISPREWKGMSVVSFNNGVSWSTPVELLGIIGPSKNKPLVTAEGTWLLPSSIETNERWQVFIERSQDKGLTWERIPVDTSSPMKVIQPTLITAEDGRIYAFCRSNQNYILESWSENNGKTWSALQPTSLRNPNSGIDGIAMLPGTYLMVFNPEQTGNEWWNGRNKLSIALSKDLMNWDEVYILENQPQGEFSYPSVIISKDGIIHITYTYNREKIKHVALKLKTKK